MAILMTRSATRPVSLPQQREQALGEATVWATGLDGVEACAVRQAVVALLESGSSWAQVRSLSGGRHRRLAPVEALLWLEQVVTTAEAVDGDVVRAHSLAAGALDRLPFRVVVTPDAIVLRWSQELGDRSQAEALLQDLVRAATADATRRRLLGI